MQAIVELVAALVVWMAVATLNHFGIEVGVSHPEPERVIQRESAPSKKAIAQEGPCPDEVAPPSVTAARTV
ncbi:hypothetical protein GVN21_09840 [Caulobacter sp. SLTY]|uniref:hypothetical protein n=1 Tax=Caulobacter sp. SLTY TaxID=2683262 RepID=UPI001412B0C8|nr:hypothetical protein [Caulobacter sp. SLTY]NBB15654.1 hypothetical protein [Caulobacter sp. SLTY]